MGIDTIVVPKFQNNWPMTATCQADGAGMAWYIVSYAQVHQAGTGQAQTGLLCIWTFGTAKAHGL